MPNPPPAEKVLAKLKVYQQIFFVLWDVLVPVSGAIVGLFVVLDPTLRDPQFYSSIGLFYGVNGVLRVMAARRRENGDA